MMNNLARSPSPVPEEEVVTQQADEELVSKSNETTLPLISEAHSTIAVEEQSSIVEQPNSASVDDSSNMSERNESSLSISMSNGFNDSTVEKKIEDLLQMVEEDSLDIP